MSRAHPRSPALTVVVLLLGCASAPGPDAAALRDARRADEEFGVPSEGEGGGAADTAGGHAASPPSASDRSDAPVRVLKGLASYYADSLAGNPTASGDPYDPTKLTAASRDLPFGTVVRVVRADTGARVTVRVNDRGPFGDRRRILDLSRAAAEALDMIRAGVVPIRAEILGRTRASR